VTYELKGDNVQNYVGDQISASGKVDPSAVHDSGHQQWSMQTES